MLYVIYLNDPAIPVHKHSSNAIASSVCARYSGVKSLYGTKLNIEKFISSHSSDIFVVPYYHEIYKHPYDSSKILLNQNVVGSYYSKKELIELVKKYR